MISIKLLMAPAAWVGAPTSTDPAPAPNMSHQSRGPPSLSGEKIMISIKLRTLAQPNDEFETVDGASCMSGCLQVH